MPLRCFWRHAGNQKKSARILRSNGSANQARHLQQRVAKTPYRLRGSRVDTEHPHRGRRHPHRQKAEEANKAFADFTGSKENIEFAQSAPQKEGPTHPATGKTVGNHSVYGGGSLETAGDLIEKRITAETERTKKLFGYDFKVGRKIGKHQRTGRKS